LHAGGDAKRHDDAGESRKAMTIASTVENETEHNWMHEEKEKKNPKRVAKTGAFPYAMTLPHVGGVLSS